MIKGGYQIIDFEDKNHSLGVGMTHKGIYDKIEGTRKAILLSGLVFEDTEIHDCFALPSIDGDRYVFPIVTYNGSNLVTLLVTVEDTDVVTVNTIS